MLQCNDVLIAIHKTIQTRAKHVLLLYPPHPPNLNIHMSSRVCESEKHSGRVFLWIWLQEMDEDSSTPLGVKMLADHLVKVKLQYEGMNTLRFTLYIERINELLQYIKTIKKEKKELQQHYKEIEDELEMRRQEIFQMKREASNDYVVEERENWKALLNQQRQENDKLKKGMVRRIS